MPAFPLQAEVRQRPELAARPVAVLSSPPRPAIAFCSRAAHEAGVRPGMAPLAARAVAPELVAFEPAEARWRQALVDLAGDLAEMSARVEVSAAPDARSGWSIQLEVPTGRRSADFARALLATAERAGYRARVGIAGDRFTARAAARFGGGPTGSPPVMRSRVGRRPFGGGEPVTIVRRGRAAAFLAPLSIELLPLAPEVRAMLRAAGVKTLGEFAALPPPSVDRPCAIDYRELARGNGPSELTPFGPLRARRARSPLSTGDGRQLSLA